MTPVNLPSYKVGQQLAALHIAVATYDCETLVNTIKSFFEEYSQEFLRKSKLKFSPGSEEEEEEIKETMDHLESFRMWLQVILDATGGLPDEQWSPNRKIIFKLKKLEVFTSARASVDTYFEFRTKMKDNDPLVVKKLRFVFEQLRDELQELAAEIKSAKVAIKL